MSIETPAYPTGSNFPIPIAPAPEDLGDLSDEMTRGSSHRITGGVAVVTLATALSGAPAMAAQEQNTSGLPYGAIELRIDSPRIDANSATLVFDQEASPSPRPSIAPSFEPSPLPSVEPSLDPNASPIPPEECPPDGQPPIAAIDGTGTVPVTPAPNTEASPSSGPDESLPPSDLSSNTGTDDTDLPPTDTDGDGIVDGDVDGDGDIDEDDKTAAIDPCAPEVSILVEPWTKETEVRAEEINFDGNLVAAVDAFYIEHPEAEEWVDSFGTKYPPRVRKLHLDECKSGIKGDRKKFPDDKDKKVALIRSGRIIRCSSMIGEFYDLGKKYNSPEAMALSLLGRDYAFQSIKGESTRDEIYDQLAIYGIQ